MLLRRFVFAAGLLASALLPAQAQDLRPMVGRLDGAVTAARETLFEVALRHRLAIDHLAFANGLPISTVAVPAGTRLVLPLWRILPDHPPANGVVINLPERGVYFFRDGKYRGFYPVSIGDEVLRKGRFWTRTGTYSIAEKQKNPTWYPPAWAADRRPVGPGPKNPLGDRWIGLSLERTGIHGTNDPYNVGNSVTHGCMRTYPELVHELYDLTRIGDTARIEYETGKIGRGPDGKLYVVTFPDVYRRGDPGKALQARLQKLGLSKRVRRSNFADLLHLGLGTPFRLDGTGPVGKEWESSITWKIAQGDARGTADSAGFEPH